MDIAQWIGNVLGQLPSWAFIPVFIIVVIVSIIIYLAWMSIGSDWPFRQKSEFIEKTAKRSVKHGKK